MFCGSRSFNYYDNLLGKYEITNGGNGKYFSVTSAELLLSCM
jgi:hypothetical protein